MKLPMPSLERVGSAQKREDGGPAGRAAGHGDRIAPPDDGGKKPLPRRPPVAGLAEFFERLLDTPPWLERTARKEAEAEAAAKKDKEDG